MARLTRAVALAGVVLLAGGALPLTGSPALGVAHAQVDEGDTAAKRKNLALMLRPVTISFDGQRIEDVMTFLKDFTGSEIEVHYADEKKPEGLDPELIITLNARELTALRVLELVLEQAARDSFEQNTWQMTPWGAIECGPKSLLNRRQRVVIYDIADLLLELPDYQDAPDIDLDSVLQSSGGGGGGGQSPFDDAGGDDEDEERDLQERRDEVIDLIQAIVEPEQWADNGGDGGTVRTFQNTLVIRAADYLHRQIDGYSWWPNQAQQATGAGVGRYVSFNLDTGLGTVDGFETVPVQAVVGGGNGGGGGGGGG